MIVIRRLLICNETVHPVCEKSRHKFILMARQPLNDAVRIIRFEYMIQCGEPDK